MHAIFLLFIFRKSTDYPVRPENGYPNGCKDHHFNSSHNLFIETYLDFIVKKDMAADRERLYKAFRKKYPKGDKEAQFNFSNDIHEDRVQVYIEIFEEK